MFVHVHVFMSVWLTNYHRITTYIVLIGLTRYPCMVKVNTKYSWGYDVRGGGHVLVVVTIMWILLESKWS